jgi:uncharacterized protein
MSEAAELIDRVTRWARTQPGIVGLLLVGSYARGAARPDSDVDFMILADSTAPDTTEFGAPIRIQAWGPVTERRFRTPSGLEFELDFGGPDWAAVDPIDPGTRRVVSDGARILFDPTGILDRLVTSLR